MEVVGQRRGSRRLGRDLGLKAVVVVGALLGAAMLAACGSSDDSDTGSRGSLAVVIPDPSGAYFQMGCGARIEGQKLGFDVGEVQAPSTPFDVAQEDRTVQSVVASNPDGLIYTPADVAAGTVSIEPAVSAGIPVVNVDAKLEDPSLYVSFVGSDGVAAAKSGGELLAEQIGESGQVAAMGILPDNPITIDRIDGFEQAMDEFPNIDVVATEYPEPDPNKLAAAAQALITKYLNIEGFYSTNDLVATGIGTALREAGEAGRVKLITWDLQEPGIKLLKEGTASGTVAQHPREWGELAVQQLANELDGEPVEKDIRTPTTLVTADNINDPEIKKLYYGIAC